MISNSNQPTIYNLDEHLPHLGGLDLGYGEEEIAQLFQDGLFFKKLTAAGLQELVLEDSSKVVENELNQLSDIYEKILKIKTYISLREQHADIIATSLARWKEKRNHIDEVINSHSENAVVVNFFLSKKTFLEEKIKHWESPLLLDEKHQLKFTAMQNNLSLLHHFLEEMKKETILEFPLKEKLSTVLASVDNVTKEQDSWGKEYLTQKLFEIDMYLDGGLVPYADVVQASTPAMSNSTQALNNLLGLNKGSPAIKALAAKQIDLMDDGYGDEEGKWNVLQQGYIDLLLSISSINLQSGSRYSSIESIDDLMTIGVTPETPAEWLQSECERYLLANYNEAVDLLGGDVPELSEASQKVRRLVGKLSGKEAKKGKLLEDLQRLSDKYISLNSMIEMYNIMSLQKNLSTDDIVQLCQFNLLGDGVTFGPIRKNDLPSNVKDYITVNAG